MNMKKVFPSLFLTLALATGVASQVKPFQAKGSRIERKIKYTGTGDPQARRKDLPPGQRNIGRPPLGQLGPNRPGLDPARKRQLQQRLMQAIGLTPDQRLRMQEIRRSHEDEVIAAGRRLRQARQSLDRAIMSENYDEQQVRRATDELTAAQAEKIRLDATIRGQVRHVLTTEQVTRFHQLQRDIRRELKEQQDRERQQDREMGLLEPGSVKDEQLPAIDLLSLLFPDN
jgi:Spy/CpxP family protein refolding chaperone